MNLDIRGQGLKVDDELLDVVSRKLGFALDRFGDRVSHVLVSLTDLNGPRGGVDLRCRIIARLHPSGRLVVEDVATDPLTAISRAAARLGQSVARFRERRRNW